MISQQQRIYGRAKQTILEEEEKTLDSSMINPRSIEPPKKQAFKRRSKRIKLGVVSKPKPDVVIRKTTTPIKKISPVSFTRRTSPSKISPVSKKETIFHPVKLRRKRSRLRVVSKSRVSTPSKPKLITSRKVTISPKVTTMFSRKSPSKVVTKPPKKILSKPRTITTKKLPMIVPVEARMSSKPEQVKRSRIVSRSRVTIPTKSRIVSRSRVTTPTKSRIVSRSRVTTPPKTRVTTPPTFRTVSRSRVTTPPTFRTVSRSRVTTPPKKRVITPTKSRIVSRSRVTTPPKKRVTTPTKSRIVSRSRVTTPPKPRFVVLRKPRRKEIFKPIVFPEEEEQEIEEEEQEIEEEEQEIEEEEQELEEEKEELPIFLSSLTKPRIVSKSRVTKETSIEERLQEYLRSRSRGNEKVTNNKYQAYLKVKKVEIESKYQAYLESGKKQEGYEYNAYLKAKDELVSHLSLHEYQQEHYNRISEILSTHVAYFDTSHTGLGKSYIAGKIAIDRNLPLFVVCPVSVIAVWEELSRKYRIPLIEAISYQTLRGTQVRELKHPYLTRRDKTYFNATPELIDIVNQDTLFVFDEEQNLKNDSAQLHSAHAIVKAVVDNPSRSKVAVLSALPGEKKEHTLSMIKLLGITTQDVFATYDRKEKRYDAYGILDVIKVGRQLNPEVTREIVTDRKFDKPGIINICFDLWVKLFKQVYCSSMVEEIDEDKIDAKNGYYKMKSSDITKIKAGTEKLQKIFVPKEKGRPVGVVHLTAALMAIETGKYSTAIRLAKSILNQDSQAQVLLYFWYMNSIDRAMKDLSNYAPMKLTGKVKPVDRLSIQNRFQADDDEFRLIIAQPKVGGVGISLDDRIGDRPRWMFLIPTYYFSDLVQAQGRIVRNSTKGIGHIRYIYSKDFPQETRILNNILSKSKIAMEIRCNLYEERYLYPADFDDVAEP